MNAPTAPPASLRQERPDLEGLKAFTRRSDRGRPLHFLGREQELSRIQAALRQVQKAGHDESAVGLTQLITAAPGAGKTALLRELGQRWGREARIVRLKISMLEDPVTPYLEMAVQLAPEAAGQLNVTTTESDTLGVRYFLEASRHKGSQRKPEIPANMNAMARWLAQTGLAQAASDAGQPDEGHGKPIVLLVDEIQNLAKLSNPSALLRDVHEGVEGLPVLMVLAGLGDSGKVLREYGISRFDRKAHLPLGSLAPGAARDAVRKFLDHFRVRGQDEQRAAWIEAIARDSCGWPQHLVSGLDGAAEALVEGQGDIGHASIAAAREAAAKLRREYYVRQAEPFAGMPEVLSAVFTAMPREQGSGATPAELAKGIRQAYQSNPRLEQWMKEGDVFDGLLHQGLIQDFGEGLYRCPIPSLRNYIEEVCASHGVAVSRPGPGSEQPADPGNEMGM